MALDRAGRVGRHRRLQGGRGRARAAEARPRGRGGDDALGAPVRRPGHLRSHHQAPRRSPRSGRRAPTPTSSTSRSPPTQRCCSSRRRPRTSSASSPRGIADDFLSALYLATRAPVLLAPAMNTNMLEHDAVRANLPTLASRGVRFVDPGAGYLACGWIGKGRLAEPEEIVEAAERILRRRARCSAGWWSSPPARPTKTSTTCGISAIDRADAWAMRWPPRRRAAARE